MHRLLGIWFAVLFVVAGWIWPDGARAVTAEDVVYQPVEASSNAVETHFRDKFVFYEDDGFFVPTRLLVESDIKACVDLHRPVCTTRYSSRAEVLKAASLYFAFPIHTEGDVAQTTMRHDIGDFTMTVTTTRTLTAGGLSLHMEVERRPARHGKVEKFTRWAQFRPSQRYAGLRMNFGEEIMPNPWMESISRVRQSQLRGFANAAIRINNHYYSAKAGRKRIRHGSGFFYRSRHRIMTAWHNLAPNPECREKLRCELRFLHTDERGIKRRFSQTVQIIAHDSKADFAILRLRLPRNVPAQILPVARDKIGPEVSIVGYPSPRFNLLYSHGYLNSLTAGTDRLVASAYVVGGYSGAPVVDLASGKLVGFAKAWQRPRGHEGDGGPVSFNIVKVLEQAYGI